MAVYDTQYNFIRLTATGDALNFKGCLAGFLLCKTGANVGTVRVTDYGKNYHIVPTVSFNTMAEPVTPIMFPGDRGMMIEGLHLGVCSNMTVIAIKR